MIGEQHGRSVNVNNRACHGGLAEHIAKRSGSRTVEPGEFEKNTGEHRFRTHGSRSSAEEWCTRKGSTGPDDFWKGDAKRSSVPGRWVPVCTRVVRSPLDQVTTSIDYVLMTIGGNDAGFGSIGQRCLVLDIAGQGRRGDQCEAALDRAKDLVLRGTFADRIDAVVSSVHSRLNPEGRQQPGTIVLNSYPYLLQNHDYAFAGLDVGAELKELHERGDAVQREVMSRFNTRTEGGCRVLTSLFADGTKAEFGDHGVSAPINTNGSDDWWLWEVVVFGAKGESLHPKRVGYEAMSRSALSTLERGGLGGCAEANTFILHRADNGGVEGQNLEETLSDVGASVERDASLPPSLDAYDSIWVVMAYEPLTVSEQEQLAAYVRNGGSLYLTGERPCCEALNASITTVINSVIDGGGVTAGGFGDIYGSFTPNFHAAGSIAVSPQRLVDFHPDAPGGMAGLGGVTGRNVFISNGSRAVAGVWDESDMATGRGRLVVLMDIDWLKGSSRSQYAINVYEFLNR